MVLSEKLLTKFVRELRVFILGLLFTVAIVPCFIFVFVPIYIFRYLLTLIAPWVRPDLGEIVSARSAVVAFDDLFGIPKCTLLTAVTVEGDVDIETVRKEMLQKIVLAKSDENKKQNHKILTKTSFGKETPTSNSSDCDCGLECLSFHPGPGNRDNLFYPEFQQFYTFWCGFTFWKWDNDFAIEDHVRVYEPSLGKQMNEIDIAQLRLNLVRSPYIKNRSPWEVLVVKNFVPLASKDNLMDFPKQRSVVIIRLHHAMSDGYSLLQIFMTQMIGQPVTHDKLESMQIAKPKFSQKNCFKTFGLNLIAAISVPYTFVRNRLACRDVNPFHISEKQLTKQIFPAGDKVPMEVIHNIRAAHGNVSFTAVLLSIVAGGIRNFMIAKNFEIPEFIRLVTPLPRPGHPSTLRNYWTFCVVKLPIGLANSSERLRFCEEYWSKSKGSARASVNFNLIPLIGALNHSLMKFFIRNRLTTVVMSNFPGPPPNSLLFGHPVLDASFGGGLGRGNLGFGFAMLSINGFLNISMGIDRGILKSQATAQELMNFVIKEVQILLDPYVI